jgi:hypothetical protein
MTARSWEDLDQFIDPADFGDVLVVTSGAAVGRETRPGSGGIEGIFDEVAVTAELSEFRTATAPDPEFACKAVDVVGMKKHDTGTIGGVEYFLDADPLPDGTGMAVLKLSRA